MTDIPTGRPIPDVGILNGMHVVQKDDRGYCAIVDGTRFPVKVSWNGGVATSALDIDATFSEADYWLNKAARSLAKVSHEAEVVIQLRRIAEILDRAFPSREVAGEYVDGLMARPVDEVNIGAQDCATHPSGNSP